MLLPGLALCVDAPGFHAPAQSPLAEPLHLCFAPGRAPLPVDPDLAAFLRHVGEGRNGRSRAQALEWLAARGMGPRGREALLGSLVDGGLLGARGRPPG